MIDPIYSLEWRDAQLITPHRLTALSLAKVKGLEQSLDQQLQFTFNSLNSVIITSSKASIVASAAATTISTKASIPTLLQQTTWFMAKLVQYIMINAKNYEFIFHDLF